MPAQGLLRAATRLLAITLCLSALCHPRATPAQQPGDDIQDLKRQVGKLIEQGRYTEMLPLLEKIAAAEPNDAATQYYLGFALVAQANSTKDDAARKAMRVRARNAWLRAKELGYSAANLDGLIQTMPPDGSDDAAFSRSAEVEQVMKRAEESFSQGKLDEALAGYQKALQLDPKLYEAALFSGDVYMNKGDYAQAEVWYQKAISIDPNRETAWRYSATPLMKQGKYDAARDRYVEAYVNEPYNRLAGGGLVQWAQVTRTRIGHPDIEIPTNVSYNDKGEPQINLEASALLGGKDDGSSAWIAYGAVRTAWYKEKFAKTFPNEKTYRHSLAEEADALRSVITLASSDKKVKTLSPAIAALKKLDDAGLLEAYILLARPDRGIAQDYAAYRQQNRDKLRRYVVEYVLTGGGK